jgi:hypothetical protein
VRALEVSAAPQLAPTRDAESYVLDVTMPLAAITADAGAVLNLGLTAVIADNAGGFSYWALSHPAATADFHRSESFALRIDCGALQRGNA